MRIKGFLSLLKKYRQGTLPDEKKKVMDTWYDAFGAENSEEADSTPVVKERIWSAVVRRTAGNDSEGVQPVKRRTFLRYSGWAAALAGIAWAGWMYYAPRPEQALAEGNNSVIRKEGWKLVENSLQTEKETLLPDGSKVILKPGSSVEFPEVFAGRERLVYMQGKAFFDVVKDQNRPFLVHAGELVVRVLGTSFTISELGGTAATEVAVMSGRVVVEKTILKDRKPSAVESKLVLTPNKKITFFKDTGHYITGLVAKPVIIEKTEEFVNPDAFDFDEVPLRQILSKMEKAYGVSIDSSNETLLDCVITADLSSDNLYGSLELICAVLNGSYEVIGNSILLSGGVCNDWKKIP